MRLARFDGRGGRKCFAHAAQFSRSIGVSQAFSLGDSVSQRENPAWAGAWIFWKWFLTLEGAKNNFLDQFQKGERMEDFGGLFDKMRHRQSDKFRRVDRLSCT